MRIGKKGRIAILAVVAIAIGVFTLSTLERLDKPAGSPRLVSIEELPDIGELCLPETANADSHAIAELDENNLFAAFQEKPVYRRRFEQSRVKRRRSAEPCMVLHMTGFTTKSW